jgi:mannose-6-phosphate isomerase
MVSLYPLRFRPLLRRYIWGGRRLERSLGKRLPPGDDWAESWEICDRGADQSVVEFGPLAGSTLGNLMGRYGRDLLGRHHPQTRFPLLLKLLDAARTLSVQVHPDDARAARLTPPDLGKTEAWVVLEAEPGSLIYAGLKPGVDRNGLATAIREGRCENCLHVVRASPGDCIFLPAGTVHAIGAGLLVAEIQQSSDVTYRLYDWNRPGPDGRPRPLHVEQGLDAIDFSRGQVEPQQPRPTERPEVERLVECEQFTLDRWHFDSPLAAGGDGRCHIVAVLAGALRIEGDPAEVVVERGGTALLPAGLGPIQMRPQIGTVLLDAYLPQKTPF